MIPLDTVSVASPCTASWDDMAGTNQVRFCQQCQKNVYNLSAMNRRQAQALIHQREGRLCVRFYRRADGTVLTDDCPVGLRAVRRRLALVAGCATAAFFAVINLGTGLFIGASAQAGSGSGSGVGAAGPLATVRSWLGLTPPPPPPPPLMGKFVAPTAVMGDMCPPEKPPPVEDANPPR